MTCSCKMRSKRSGVTPPYQMPSGYTTSHGPCVQMRKQAALVRMTGMPISRTRVLMNSQSFSPSPVSQQSGPKHTKR